MSVLLPKFAVFDKKGREVENSSSCATERSFDSLCHDIFERLLGIK